MSLYDRASIIPGRSCTRSKSPDRLLKAWATVPWKAWGWGGGERFTPYVEDTDGRRYLDTLSGLGAISLGYHTRPTFAYGVSSLPSILEVEAGEAVLQHIAPWASSVRFFKTGSEATHAAYRIAKKAIGRDNVLIGNWAYHGWHEWSDPDQSLFYCDRITHGGPFPLLENIAAVFIEPHRWEPVDVGWLRSVRAFCDQIGALLVFDSMIYGGRWALGGASQYFGVTPDLECFGKAYGNGQAVAFLVGRDALAEHGEIASGTYSGDVTGLSALLTTLDVYTSEPVIKTLWARGEQLQAGLKDVVPPEIAVVEGAPVHQRIRFLNETQPASAGAYDYRTERPRARKFRELMAEQGVLMLPDAINVMYSHTEAQIDQVIEAVADTFKEM